MILVQSGDPGGHEKIAGELREESVQKILLGWIKSYVNTQPRNISSSEVLKQHESNLEQGSTAMPVGLLALLDRKTLRPMFSLLALTSSSMLALTCKMEPSVLLVK